MNKEFEATISMKSKRAQDWIKLFGSRDVPIQSPIAGRADLPGKPNARIYEIDLKLLTGDQRLKLIAYIAKKFKIPPPEVERDLDEVGCPILAEDVTVTIHNPHKWI